MYKLRPKAVYMLDRVQEDPRAIERVARMLGALDLDMDDAQIIAEDNLYDVVRELQQWPPDDLAEGVPMQWQRPLVFTQLVTRGTDPKRPTLIARRPEDVEKGALRSVLGYIDPVRGYHTYEGDADEDMVCWPTQDFGVMSGCPHGCQYCGEGRSGKFIAVGANIEEYVDEVIGPTIERTPGQKCFRMIGWGADTIAFEPEYGVFELFLQKLSEYEDRYGYFHTATDNVDWIADVPHRDRLIGVWSMMCEAIARDIEPGSPSAAARVEAMGKCCDWGLPVRIKFKPTIPVRNWREEYADVIRDIFQRCRPETMGFCVIMWMTTEALKSRIDPELLDPELLQAAEDASERMESVRTGPYPPEVRAQIYRHQIQQVRRWDQDIPLFISTESRAMWEELGDELGQSPRTFACGCNPVQLPGPRMSCSRELPHSTFFPTR
jgi:DNA repair photolyase